jgi:hypothetical protein
MPVPVARIGCSAKEDLPDTLLRDQPQLHILRQQEFCHAIDVKNGIIIENFAIEFFTPFLVSSI